MDQSNRPSQDETHSPPAKRGRRGRFKKKSGSKPSPSPSPSRSGTAVLPTDTSNQTRLPPSAISPLTHSSLAPLPSASSATLPLIHLPSALHPTLPSAIPTTLPSARRTLSVEGPSGRKTNPGEVSLASSVTSNVLLDASHLSTPTRTSAAEGPRGRENNPGEISLVSPATSNTSLDSLHRSTPTKSRGRPRKVTPTPTPPSTSTPTPPSTSTPTSRSTRRLRSGRETSAEPPSPTNNPVRRSESAPQTTPRRGRPRGRPRRVISPSPTTAPITPPPIDSPLTGERRVEEFRRERDRLRQFSWRRVAASFASDSEHESQQQLESQPEPPPMTQQTALMPPPPLPRRVPMTASERVRLHRDRLRGEQAEQELAIQLERLQYLNIQRPPGRNTQQSQEVRDEVLRRANDQHRTRAQQRLFRRGNEIREQIEELIRPNFVDDPPDFPQFNEANILTFDIGEMNAVCEYCQAHHFEGERPAGGKFTSCCQKGRIRLDPPMMPFPRFLQDALTVETDPFYEHVRRYIRNYNSAMSFASLGANISPPPGYGVPCFRINGQIHHYMQTLDVPNLPDGQQRRYAQLYFLDSTEQANEIRLNHPANQDLNILFLTALDQYFRDYNHYAALFRVGHELLEDLPAGVQAENVRLVFNNEFSMQGVHQGRQNAPTTDNEIAAVFALDNDGLPNYHRDFAVHLRNDVNQALPTLDYIKPTSPHLLPLCYPLIRPHGEPGWHIGFRCIPYDHDLWEDPRHINGAVRDDRSISLLQWTSANLQERNEFNPMLHAGYLTQQLIVDLYVSIEENNLDWVRMNQLTLRANQYHALNAYVRRQAQAQGHQAAPAIILPSTFKGSQRNMRQNCLDAMAIFSKLGPPDFFLTFTCDPHWVEISRELLPGEQPHDRPDIVARVFNLKVRELMEMVKSGGVFGPVVCWVYTLEFQKRGLPHIHLLVKVEQASRPDTPAKIDRVVCAELPDRQTNPILFDIVRKKMVHGPCRVGLCKENPTSYCKKSFPKPSRLETELVENNYPNYRRRPNDPSQNVPGFRANNRMVIPYNPFLTLYFKAHINVEVVSNMQSAIKYIYKYIFKGFDVANLRFDRQGNAVYDETRNYVNCRYVSPPEAIANIFCYNHHDRSHTVTRLPIHLENPDEVVFDEAMEIPPEREDERAMTMLHAFFTLNADPNSNSRHLMYRDIPIHFVFNATQRRWNPRQQRGDRVVARIRDVNPLNRELFSLRVLLLNVPGPQSFEDIRTINGVEFATFLEAAQNLNLMLDDRVYRTAFEELAGLNLPPQLRQFFFIMLYTKAITNAVQYWDEFKQHMIHDFRRHQHYRNYTDDQLYQLALHDLNNRCLRCGHDLRRYGLPLPLGDPPAQNINPPLPITINNIVLNPAQQNGFDRIMDAVRGHDSRNPVQRLFVVIGPGGSGKTTLYKKIIEACKTANFVAKVYATTGIAATLMEGGATAHRGFGIPVELDNESSSWMLRKLNCEQAEELRRTHVLLIDEITMMTKNGLRVINQLLQGLMNNTQPFGGKVVVVGGDFRQLLPVVPRGLRAHIVADSVINCTLWSRFEVITLNTNMRAQGDAEFAEWLLQLGTGSLPSIPNVQNIIEIPQQLLLFVPPRSPALPPLGPDDMPYELTVMVDEIFGDVNALTTLDLSNRAILASTVKQVMNINNHLISLLLTPQQEYLSADELTSADPSDQYNFPVEYLNKQQPSGMPPHKLKLKVGVVVMLLRNMDPNSGLSNGTRLIVRTLTRNAIVAEIISESHRGEQVMLTRMDMSSGDSSFSFTLKRRQFPLIPAFAMTINKSQGQTIDRVGIYLPDPVFAHGQLYVALSRSRHQDNIKVYVRDSGWKQGRLMKHVRQDRHRVYTQNIVYREVFQHGEIPQPEPVNTIPELHTIDPQLARIMEEYFNQEAESDAYDAEMRRMIQDNPELRRMLDQTLPLANAADFDDDSAPFDVPFTTNLHVQDLLFAPNDNNPAQQRLHQLEQEYLMRGQHPQFRTALWQFIDVIDIPAPPEDNGQETLQRFVEETENVVMNLDMELPGWIQQAIEMDPYDISPDNLNNIPMMQYLRLPQNELHNFRY